MKEILQASVRSVQKPTEGKWFEVNPKEINQELFQDKRKDYNQERTRQIILEAFTELKNNPEKYAKTFETMMPVKNWSSKTVAELKELASNVGDHMANRTEQALEWAQRIHNGESWETICNEADTANYYRLVECEKNYVQMVGGASQYFDCTYSASDIFHAIYIYNSIITCAVPLIVRYK